MDRRPAAGIGDDRGFTLIELLIAMLISIIVIGGAVVGLTNAFKSTTSAEGRTSSTTQGELRLEILTRDLRDATTCPSGLADANLNAVSGVFVAGTNAASPTQSDPSLEMCDPQPGNSSGTGSAPPLSLVSWRCSAATESCTRCTEPISGSALVPVSSPSTLCAGGGSAGGTATDTIAGVQSLNVSGLLGEGTSSGVSTLSVGTNYPLSAGTTAVSYVQLTASLYQLAYPDSAGNTTTVPGSSLIPVQTGIELRNNGGVGAW